MTPSTDELTRDWWEPAPPACRPVLFVNPRSGGGKNQRGEVADRARERGIEVVVLTPGRDLAALAGHAVARGADALGMAGGDGSLAIVAEAAATHGLPFVCVPAGTRNHFAIDVGVDRHDLLGALDAFVDGVERRIDMAAVNGRAFLNNVSLGVYGEAVQRPEYRGAKVRTVLETAMEVFGPGGEAPELRLVDDTGHEYHDPVMVVVSNNPYVLGRPPATGMRPTLDVGRLGIIVIYSEGRGRPLRGAIWSAPSIELDATGTVPAGIDGEAVRLTPPLSFVIRPATLRVRISSRHAQASRLERLGIISSDNSSGKR